MPDKTPPTRVGLLCGRLIEAGWLGALLLTPLLFDVHSDSSFELDKAMSLRALALLIGVAWILRRLEGSRASQPDASSNRWWTALAIAMLASQTVATAGSVDPRLSFLGSLTRAQGFLTTAAYLLVFLSLLAWLRRPEQLERIVTAVLVTSFPVSLYGIVQHFGIDPVVWSGDVSVRVASTLGNPIFVAAFLAMTLPLTLYRHLAWSRRIVAEEGPGVRRVLAAGGILSLALQVAGWWLGPATGSLVALAALGIWMVEGRLLRGRLLDFLAVGTYSVLLSAQLTCLLLSQSRGPLLGLAVGLGLLSLLHGVARGAWRRVALTAVLGLAAFSTLLWMNVPGSPLSFARELPYLDRLASALASTGRVRLLIWEAVDERIERNPVRALLGYGPETLRLVSAPVVSPAVGQIERRGALPDRAHNELLDRVATTGYVGAALYLALFSGLVLWAVPKLGAATSRRERLALAASWLGGGALGGVGTGFWAPGRGLWGPAIPLGMVAGLGIYLIGRAAMGARHLERPPHARWTGSQLLMACLLAALVAHWVETQVGIAITATRAYFWTYAAMLVSAARLEVDARSPRAGHSLLVATILGTVIFGLLSGETGAAEAPTLGWLLGGTWLFGGLVGLTGPGGRRGLLAATSRYAAVTLSAALAFGIAHVLWLRRLADEPWNAPVLFGLFVLAMLGAVARSLARAASERPARVATLPGVLALALLGASAVFIVIETGLDVVRANIAYKQARFGALVAGGEERALRFVERALELDPGRTAYRAFLGELLAKRAQRATGAATRDARFQEAEGILTACTHRRPLDPELWAKLARLYARWALQTRDGDRRQDRYQASLASYERAHERWPGNVLLWNERAALHLSMGERDRALETYRHSLRLDDRFVETYLQLGDLWRMGHEWEKAAEAFERAVEADPRVLEAHHALAQALLRMGRLEDAIRAHERAIARHENDARSHEELSRLYFSTGRFDRAKLHGERALALAPPGEKIRIERFLVRVERALSASR